MPRALARALSASSNGRGTRMLICSSFFSNSNRIGLNCEKSSSDRSCARNFSAALSVLSFGTFFFIGGDFLRVPGLRAGDNNNQLGEHLKVFDIEGVDPLNVVSLHGRD